MAFDDRLCDVDELAPVVLRVRSEHLERALFVDGVALHQDALRALRHGAPPEGALQVVVLGEAAERDVERALQLPDSIDETKIDAKFDKGVLIASYAWEQDSMAYSMLDESQRRRYRELRRRQRGQLR